jgi:CheY-like chemotaxis protein
MRDYILIVDDEYEIREILRLMLTRVGHPIRTATNGQEVLELIREEQPAIILLDIMMRILDGREMFLQLRGNPALCSIPVLFISALPRARAHLTELGVEDLLVDHIEKSDFTPQGLMEMINGLMEHAASLNFS